MPYVFGGSSGGGGQLPTIAFFGSQTWTPTYDVTAKVFVIGGGGGGGSSSGHNDRAATGGGAGGCAISEITFSSGTAYTITVGAGGDGALTNGNASAGSASSLSGSGISTMTANGGGAGVGTGAVAAGGAGGSASGGTIANFTGGAGGSASANNTCSGGGSVGLWQTGNAAPAASTGSHGGKMGGSLNFDTDTYTAPIEFNNFHPSGGSTINYAGIPTLSPFSDLRVDEREYRTTGGYQSGEDRGFVVPRGAGMPTGFYSYGHYNSANYYHISGPFGGGTGAGPHTTPAVAGRGSLGGGGGGAFTTSNLHGAFGGHGGDGGVLIFPSSIG